MLLESDGSRDFGGFFGGYEGGDQSQTKVDRGACAARGEQASVEHGALVGEDVWEFSGHAGVGGVAASGEQAGIVQHGGRGADGGEQGAGGVVAGNQFAHGGRGAEERHAGSAGQEQAIEGRGVGGEGGEGQVGVKREGVAAGDVDAGTEGGEGNLAAGAAEEVDGGDGFEFFKSFRQDNQDRGHSGGSETQGTGLVEPVAVRIKGLGSQLVRRAWVVLGEER